MVLDGKDVDGAIGQYDLELALAARYQWTLEQIGDMPEDFLIEALARMEAEGDRDRDERAKRERERRRKERRARLGRRMAGKDVDMAEIS